MVYQADEGWRVPVRMRLVHALEELTLYLSLRWFQSGQSSSSVPHLEGQALSCGAHELG